MELSRFFTLEELTRSQTAQALGLPNVPDETQIGNLRALCERVLDPLRSAVGIPVKINSGFRARSVNEKLPGASKTSQHLDGMAADIQAPGMTVLELFKRAIQLGLPFDQIIYEAKDPRTKWVHVSHDPKRVRAEILVANFLAGGRVTYRAVTAAQALAIEEPRARDIGPVEMRYVEIDDAPPQKRRAPAKRKAVRRAKPKVTRPKTKPTKKAAPKIKAAAKKRKVPSSGTARSPKRNAVARKGSPRKTGSKKVAKPRRLTVRG